MRTIAAGDLVALEKELLIAKARCGLPLDGAVQSCYEAGRDGVWLHRWLAAQGVEHVVVESSSIEVNRRARRAFGNLGILGNSLEVSSEEPAQHQSVHPLERCDTSAVMPARQDVQLVGDASAAELVDEHLREPHGERQIVPRVHEQGSRAAHPLDVRKRRDWKPEAPELFELDVAVQTMADVCRRQPFPDDVGEVRGDVIQRRGPDERLVCCRQHREAGPQAGAENADRLVAL